MARVDRIPDSIRSLVATAGLWPALRSFPVLTLALGLVAYLLYLSPAATHALQYDTAAPLVSQPLRFLAGHWAHWSAGHLGWSGLAFVVLGAACERRGRRRFVACVVAAALLIPLTLWALQPAMHTYRGLSGIDSALFVLLAATLLAERWREPAPGRAVAVAAVVLALLAFSVKLVFEAATGMTLFVAAAADADGFAPAPLAHLAGAAAGALVAAARRAAPTGSP